MVTGAIQQDTMVPSIISLEGPDVEPCAGSFAVLSQYLINKMDTLERQFQKWYTSLILGLGRLAAPPSSSVGGEGAQALSFTTLEGCQGHLMFVVRKLDASPRIEVCSSAKVLLICVVKLQT